MSIWHLDNHNLLNIYRLTRLIIFSFFLSFAFFLASIFDGSRQDFVNNVLKSLFFLLYLRRLDIFFTSECFWNYRVAIFILFFICNFICNLTLNTIICQRVFTVLFELFAIFIFRFRHCRLFSQRQFLVVLFLQQSFLWDFSGNLLVVFLGINLFIKSNWCSGLVFFLTDSSTCSSKINAILVLICCYAGHTTHTLLLDTIVMTTINSVVIE